MHPIQVRLTKTLIKMLDELVDKGTYPNRSEAIRDAVRKLVNLTNSGNNNYVDMNSNSFNKSRRF